MPAYSASHSSDLGWPPRKANPGYSLSSWVLICITNSGFPQEFQFVCSCFPYCMPVFSPQLSSLKQRTFLTLQFLRVKNLEVVYLAPWAHGLSLGCSQGIGHDSSLIGRPNHWRICFQASSCGVGRIQLIIGCGTEGLISSLAVGQKLPQLFAI